MASIYCEDHGLLIAETLVAAPKEEEKGAFSKVVIGPIMVEECRCNSCNRPIDLGDTAVYVSHHNNNWPDDHGGRNYIDISQSKVYKI